jgi:FkbM family methyltransferase
MKYTRHYVEAKGKMSAGIIEQHDDWTLLRALGVLMYARTADFSVTPCLIKDGYWESWITAWFLNNVEQVDMFVDIGANTGYYSILADNKGVEVVAYEPNPDYVEMIIESTKLTSHETAFKIFPYAISNKNGLATLTIPGQFEGSASITNPDFSAYTTRDFQVNTVTLDHHFNARAQTSMLIKVDAEGAEELVWSGATETNQRHAPVWMMEYTPGAYSETFLDKLEEYGNLSWINHDGAEEPISKVDIITANDWLMLVIRPRG